MNPRTPRTPPPIADSELVAEALELQILVNTVFVLVILKTSLIVHIKKYRA